MRYRIVFNPLVGIRNRVFKNHRNALEKVYALWEVLGMKNLVLRNWIVDNEDDHYEEIFAGFPIIYEVFDLNDFKDIWFAKIEMID